MVRGEWTVSSLLGSAAMPVAEGRKSSMAIGVRSLFANRQRTRPLRHDRRGRRG